MEYRTAGKFNISIWADQFFFGFRLKSCVSKTPQNCQNWGGCAKTALRHDLQQRKHRILQVRSGVGQAVVCSKFP